MDEMNWLRFFVGGWGSFFTAYVLAQVAVPLLVHGRRRTWALVPLPLMLLVAAVTAQGYFEQSNLWPIWLIFVSPVALFYLVVIGVNALLRKAPSASASHDAL